MAVLKEVIDQETVHFRMRTPFDLCVPGLLPMPPFEIPVPRGSEGTK